MPVPEETALQRILRRLLERKVRLEMVGSLYWVHILLIMKPPFDRAFQNWVLLQCVLCFVSVYKKFNLWAHYNFPLAETKQSWWCQPV